MFPLYRLAFHNVVKTNDIMETKCVLQRCITKGVSIITVIVKNDFFYYTYIFVSLYSFDKEIRCRRKKLSENFKVLK